MIRSIPTAHLPPSVAKLYEAYSFSAADTTPAFAYDSVTQWRQMTTSIQGGLYKLIDGLVASGDARLAAQELEFAEKLGVCWRLRGQGTLFTPNPESELTCRNATQASALAPLLAKRGKQYAMRVLRMEAAELSDMYQKAPLKLNKGKGAPYWNPGTDRDVTYAYHRLVRDSRSFEDISTRVRSVASARMPLVQTSYIRIQSARGERENYVPIDGVLTQAGLRSGPKVRRIAAQPFVVNHLWAGVGNVMRTIMATEDGGKHGGTLAPALQLSAERRFRVAVDLKSYDTTVGLETLDAVRTLVMYPVLNALAKRGLLSRSEIGLLLDCDEQTQHLAILMPPRKRSEGAYIVDAVGQTRSGENLTSFKGTIINDDRCKAKKTALGLSGSAVTLNYGDDTVLFTDDARDVDKWMDANQMFGFNEEAAPDATFLMRRIPEGYSYLGRMVMGSVDREPAHEPSSVLGAASAFAIRRELLRGHPLENQFYGVLESAAGPDRYRRAVEVAKASSNAVELAMAAHAMRPLEKSQETDDRLEALEALAEQPTVSASTRVDAARALKVLLTAETAEGVQVHWDDFRKTSGKLSIREAEALIRAKAYTLGRVT